MKTGITFMNVFCVSTFDILVTPFSRVITTRAAIFHYLEFQISANIFCGYAAKFSKKANKP
jgi:hypothetical protein